MRKAIWKFKLDVAGSQPIDLPKDAKVLHLEVQDGAPCMWVMLDSEAPTVTRELLCFETGREVSALEDQFVGTVLAGPFVWHYFWG